MSSMDRIEKQVRLKAPRSRVWRALTDAEEFGEWFRVKLVTHFAKGERALGHITYPGYEHLRFEAMVERMEPERLFSLRWHPAAVDATKDYSGEPSTLVEFRLLDDEGGGTLLTVSESGFDALPPDRRHEAFRMNDEGWAIQMTNIARHVDG
jgi:uncharacterized protein YndB with AHSA1/START domain